MLKQIYNEVTKLYYVGRNRDNEDLFSPRIKSGRAFADEDVAAMECLRLINTRGQMFKLIDYAPEPTIKKQSDYNKDHALALFNYHIALRNIAKGNYTVERVQQYATDILKSNKERYK